MWQRLKIAAVGVWLEVTLLPSETITKLEILRNNTPITYEGMNVKKELIISGLIQEQEETLK